MSYPFQRIMITGGSGFLGQYLIDAAPDNAEVLSLYNRHPLPHSSAKQLHVDLTEESKTAALLQEWKPDLVIHAAALSDTHACEERPELSHRINVYTTEHLAERCHHMGIPIVFTSTDLVFDGIQPPYRPEDAVTPVSTYGRHKVEAEQVLRRRHPEGIIARLPVMYGLPPEKRKNVLTALLHQWLAGQTPNLFTDEYRSMAYARDVAEGIYRIALHPGEVFHLGGPTPVSRYAFGNAVRQLLRLPEDSIHPTRQTEVKLTAPRPANVSMDSSKAYAIGYRPADISTALSELASALQEAYQHWSTNG